MVVVLFGFPGDVVLGGVSSSQNVSVSVQTTVEMFNLWRKNIKHCYKDHILL